METIKDKKDMTNVEFITHLMEFCPTGSLGQSFIVQAITDAAKQTAAAKEQLYAQEENGKEGGFVSLKAWADTAEWLYNEMEAKYGGKDQTKEEKEEKEESSSD